MQLVPIITQPKVGIEERLKVAGVAAVSAVKPVVERNVPSMSEQGGELQRLYRETNQRERRLLFYPQDRRVACRRFQHLAILEELRSMIDRRRHKRRSSDSQPHIDEEA